MEVDYIVSLLKRLNFTESEVKAYIALLQYGSSSGYEASKLSAIPRSKIYCTLENLITKGLVICSKNANHALYQAVPVEEVLKNLKRDFDCTTDAVETELNVFKQGLDLGYIWQIRDYDNVFDKCRNILQKTKNELYLQVWREDFDEIATEVIDLEEKGLSITLILYSLDNNFDIPLKNYYSNGLGREKFKEISGRWITLVSDSKEVIFGQIQNKRSAEVVWTERLPLVIMARGYIKNDVYFSRIMPTDKPGWFFSSQISTGF